jgi:hypothetical protein
LSDGKAGDSPEAFFVLATSDDDGQTWQGGLVLDDREGVSYSDGFQAPDGTIFISYESRSQMLISRPLARRTADAPK